MGFQGLKCQCESQYDATIILKQAIARCAKVGKLFEGRKKVTWASRRLRQQERVNVLRMTQEETRAFAWKASRSSTGYTA